MKNILVTGARGFIGRNLVTALRRRSGEAAVDVRTFTREDEPQSLARGLRDADLVFHLAGANRPPQEEDFYRVNAGLTAEIVDQCRSLDRPPAIVFSSSIQASGDHAYGSSKRQAEEILTRYHEQTGSPVCIYRLPNVFGKWSRPDYNSVVATFCHRLTRDVEMVIHNPDHPLILVPIDEVVRCLLRHLDPANNHALHCEVEETFAVTVGELARRLESIRNIRRTLKIPDLSEPLTRYLHATYISFLPTDQFSSAVEMKTDDRGWLFELVKSDAFGQVFVSTTKPGVTRGNHYHDTKVEKFCLVQGEGLIRFRPVETDEIIEYPVDDRQIKIVDIPPGYTHSIENIGDREMVVLFWANEVFDPQRPDTWWTPVLK